MPFRTVTVYYEFQAQPVLNTASPTYDYSTPFGGITQGLGGFNVISFPSPLYSGGPRSDDDAPILEAVRLVSNLADGFVWTPTCGTGFAFWMGTAGQPIPASFIETRLQTFNEWYSVDMPLPRDPAMVAPAAVMMNGNLEFHFDIRGINPVFNGLKPTFTVQARLKTALW